MQNLAVEIRQLDDVVIKNIDPTDPGRSQIGDDRGPQTAGSDHGDTRTSKPVGTAVANLSQTPVPCGSCANKSRVRCRAPSLTTPCHEGSGTATLGVCVLHKLESV